MADFGGDGRSDLLWYSAATGQTSIWLMSRTRVMSQSVVLTDPHWRVTAPPDLNSDGKADLLWNHPPTDETVIRLMNGATPSSYSSPSVITDAR